MRQKRNVIFFGDVWDEQYRRRQAMAIELARQDYVNEVVYIEQPLTLISLIKYCLGRVDDDAKRRWHDVLENGYRRKREGITVFTPFNVFPLINKPFLWGISVWLSFISSFLHLFCLNIKRNNGLILIISLPNWTCRWGKFLRPDIFIYDCSESFDRQGQNLRMPSWQLNKIREWDNSLTKEADIVLVNSPKLLKEKLPQNPNTCLFLNAVPEGIIDVFKQKEHKETSLDKLKGPIFGYVGHLNELVDIELLEDILQKRPQWNIVIVGDSGDTGLSQRLKKYNNLYLTGKVPFYSLPCYISRFDVCLGLYKMSSLNETNTGLKFPLYAVFGKPVVSTNAGGVAAFSNNCNLCIVSKREDFIPVLEEALNSKSQFCETAKDRDLWEFTWNHRIRILGGLIKDGKESDD